MARKTRTSKGLSRSDQYKQKYQREYGAAEYGATEYGAAEYGAYEKAPERKKKIRRKKHYLLKFFITICVIVGLIYLGKSHLFDISEIEVVDNSYYTQEQIVEMTGAKVGDNLFTFRVRNLEEELLKHTYIESCDVKRKLPDKLQIVVTERKEAAYISYNGHYYYVDYKGYVLRKEEKKPSITCLSGVKVKKVKVGTALSATNNSMLTRSLNMLKAAAGHDITFEKVVIKPVVCDSYLKSQLIVRGDPEDVAACIESDKLGLVIYDLYKDKKKTGLIRVGADNYCTYSKTVR